MMTKYCLETTKGKQLHNRIKCNYTNYYNIIDQCNSTGQSGLDD